MFNYERFYEIAERINENGRGDFTPREVACNAYSYLCEFNFSFKAQSPTETIKELCKLLVEDGSEQCLDWAYDIADALNLIDMDYLDYMETDPEVIRKFLEGK